MEALEKQKADLAFQHQEAVAQLKAQWAKDKETEIQLQVTKQLVSAKKIWQEEQQEVSSKFTKYNRFEVLSLCLSVCPLCYLKKWEQKLEEAMMEKQKAKSTGTQDNSSQTDTMDSVSQLLSLEQLEDRLHAQRMALEQETDGKLKKAVEEALRSKERELQQKHVQDTTLQVNFTHRLGLCVWWDNRVSCWY